MFGRKWVADEILYLKNTYPVSNDWDKMCKDLNRSKRSIQHQITKLNLRKEKNYIINHHFFDNWSVDMAYILGFIITDGCINKDGRLSFGVSSKDKCVLEYISNNICPGRNVIDSIEYRNGSSLPTSRLRINSKLIKDRLLKYGVCENKTGKEILPDCPKEFKYDLLRGIFDGDGCIFNRGNGYLNFKITSASLDFLQNIQSKLLSDFGFIYQDKNENHYDLIVYKQNDIKYLYNKMYYNGYKFALERKRIKFNE